MVTHWAHNPKNGGSIPSLASKSSFTYGGNMVSIRKRRVVPHAGVW